MMGESPVSVARAAFLAAFADDTGAGSARFERTKHGRAAGDGDAKPKGATLFSVRVYTVEATLKGDGGSPCLRSFEGLGQT